MGNLIRKKIVLSLLDSDPKPANKIADEISTPLATVENYLTALISENICEKRNQHEVSQYVVKKDIETFARLVKGFLSDKEEHKEEIERFITSEYYFTRIDNELVDYMLRRFDIDWIYQTDEEKQQIERILLASPSTLFFALHDDTTIFSESQAGWDPLNSSAESREKLNRTLRQSFETSLTEMLLSDMRARTYGCLFDKLQVRIVKIEIQVSLATVHEKYVEAIGKQAVGCRKAADDLTEDLRPGQWFTYVNPMDGSDDGLAFLHLGEFKAAIESFDYAFDAVQDPIQKAIVLNNKGLAFLHLEQYQKAIECFEEGIALDSKGEIFQLSENKQVAEEYLACATDADNLTQPTQVRFVHDLPVPFEETRFYEFKEIMGRNPVGSVTNTADEYAVAFLNCEGGRIFWGVRDSDRMTVGVTLDDQQRDEVRREISQKLWAIRPSISDENWQLEFHHVYDLQGETVEDLWVIELVVPPQQEKEVFYTNSGELFVKTLGGKQKLLGPQVTEFIRSRFQNDTETP